MPTLHLLYTRMMLAENDDHRLSKRRTLFEWLVAESDTMLRELADVAGVAPRDRIIGDPQGALEQIRSFLQKTDFAEATEDGRTWLLNRLGLYLGRLFIQRHGGRFMLHEDPKSPFFLHFVVGEMSNAAVPGTTLDPFAIAFDAINNRPKLDLMQLISTAEEKIFSGN
jgi:hypothetical protein